MMRSVNRRYKPPAALRALGQLYKRHRKDRGLTVDQLAKQAQVPVRSIRQIEDGCFHMVPDPDLEVVSRLFGMEVR